MFSSINRVIKARAKAFKIFHKLIKRLEKQALKLERLESRAVEKEMYYKSAQKDIKTLAKENNQSIDKIRELFK